MLSGNTVPADLALQLQLMAAYVGAPGYRPEALERFRKGLPQLYQSLDRTPIGVMQRDVTRFLRDGDPRFGYPAQPALASLTLDDLRTTLAAPLAHGYLEISLVGISTWMPPSRRCRRPSAAFRNATPNRRTTARRGRPLSRDPGPDHLFYDTVDPKAMAAVYWPTTDFSNVSEVRRLFVLAKALGNRVLERVRNEQGLTYSAQGNHAPSQAFPGFGYLYAIVDAPPGKARQLAEEMSDIGAAIYRDGISADELERARNPLVSELKRLLQTNGYLLSAIVSGSQENPEKLKRATTSVPELESMTVADLDQVARKYLKPDAALPVVIVPRQKPKPEAARSTQRRAELVE